MGDLHDGQQKSLLPRVMPESRLLKERHIRGWQADTGRAQSLGPCRRPQRDQTVYLTDCT
jgi:hypothetical protein